MSLADEIDKYDYDPKSVSSPNWIRYFLWFCAGADRQLLKHCPQSERIKEEGIGGVVLATAVLAFLSSFYAFYTVFVPKLGFAASAAQSATDQPTAIKAMVGALVWAIIVFNLDRLIVSTGGNDSEQGSKKFMKALPRLLMAMIIGFTLSKPLEIKVMESEINANLQEVQQSFFKQQMGVEDDFHKNNLQNIEARKSEVISARKAKQAEFDAISKKVSEFQDVIYKEASGKAANQKAGEGPGYRAAKANLDRAEAEKAAILEENRIVQQEYQTAVAELNKKIDDENLRHDEVRKQTEEASHAKDGLMVRIHEGHQISPIGSWALTLLLMVIEVAPVLYKLMLENGPYHYLTENQKEISIARFAIQRKNSLASGGDGQAEQANVFHQAEIIAMNRISELNAESRISDHALAIYEKRIKDEIDRDPDKFIDSIEQPKA